VKHERATTPSSVCTGAIARANSFTLLQQMRWKPIFDLFSVGVSRGPATMIFNDGRGKVAIAINWSKRYIIPDAAARISKFTTKIIIQTGFPHPAPVNQTQQPEL